MSWRRVLLAGLVSGMALGCAPARPAAPAANRTQKSALDTARALRKRAEALHAPIYSGPDDKGAKGEFMSGPLRQWVVQRMKLHRRALAAYRDAIEQAPDTASKLSALDEMGEMELSLADEFVHAAVAAMPGEYRHEKGMAAAFTKAMRGAVAPRVESARKAFKQCRSLSRASKVSTPASRRCDEKLAAMPPPVATTPAPPPVAPKADSLPVPDRPLVPSSQKTPCVLSGTLRTFAELDDASGTRIGFIDDPPGVEVSALRLPAKKGGRARVSLSWPIVFSGTLSPRSLPLVTRQRLELVNGHIWVAKGTAVTAFHPSGSQAVVYRDFRDGKPGSKTEPAELSRRVACSQLALAQGQRPPLDADTRSNTVYLTGLVSLYASPGKGEIGRIQLPRVVASRATLLERRGDFVRVRGEHGFSFDAWVPASALSKSGVLGMLSERGGRYTHVVQRAVQLRLRPANSAPVVAKLSKGAYLRVGPLDSGFVPIRVSGVYPANRSRAFYIDARDLPALAPVAH